MTNPWFDDNSAYLSAAIAWLRLRLEHCAQKESGSTSIRRKDGIPEGAKQSSTSLEQRISAASNEMAAIAAGMKSSPALVLICDALGLSSFERDILLLCSAQEFDSSIRKLCIDASRAALAGADERGLPTFALALSLFDNPTWDALSPDRPLRYWHLLEIDLPGSQPLALSTLRTDERIVDFLKGLNRLDDRLSPYLTPVGRADGAPPLPPSQQTATDAIVATWQLYRNADHLPLIQLAGPHYESKRMIAAKAAAQVGRNLYRLSADALPVQVAEIELLSRIWQRESTLLPLALLVDAQHGEVSADGHMGAARRFLSQASGFVFLLVREGWGGITREICSFEIAKPTREEQRSAWLAAIGPKLEDLAALLASQFNLGMAEIQRIAEQSLAQEMVSDETIRETIWDHCVRQVRPLLDTLARRIDVRATWNDIVLPQQELRMLHEISAQVRKRSRVYDDWGFGARMNRGLGITALFTGDSGVGKTMAAEVIATDLRLSLYRIDLSSVVSKYIGETEKNLGKLFDAAEDGGAILFFDEADALFGKRSEVKDSHDRYANIEVNYLLQRMESYSGLAILATNMRGALDLAFTRRLRFIVNFPFPNVADRELMWRKVFPSKTPVGSLDYGRIAKFNLTGGSISNAAVNAAFLAASKGNVITMAHTLAAIRQEMQKLERPLRDCDFEWEDDLNEGQAAARQKVHVA